MLVIILIILSILCPTLHPCFSGWMVVPLTLIDVMNRLGQNLYINAPTLSQLAAVHAFDPACREELEGHVRRYAANRDIVLGTLRDLGLDSGASPADGAFYVYVDLSVRYNLL